MRWRDNFKALLTPKGPTLPATVSITQDYAIPMYASLSALASSFNISPRSGSLGSASNSLCHLRFNPIWILLVHSFVLFYPSRCVHFLIPTCWKFSSHRDKRAATGSTTNEQHSKEPRTMASYETSYPPVSQPYCPKYNHKSSETPLGYLPATNPNPMQTPNAKHGCVHHTFSVTRLMSRKKMLLFLPLLRGLLSLRILKRAAYSPPKFQQRFSHSWPLCDSLRRSAMRWADGAWYGGEA
ncbi:hypothetical protein BDZ97DRAFT_259265 [Flammula alnicola]|nr:hypothetical protein BDZ97DRAFT_259265 [Flammula alnicola]